MREQVWKKTQDNHQELMGGEQKAGRYEDAHMKEAFPVEGHAPSLLPADKEWKLVWNDEFDGFALDRSKWDFRTDFWGKHSPTFIGEEGVELDGESHLKMNLVFDGTDYYSSHMQTGALTYDTPKAEGQGGFWPFGKKPEPKFMHGFGYYEICCKLPKNDGWHAAFWLQSPSVGAHPDAAQCGVECDIMENYRQHTEGLIVCGNGWNGYGPGESKWCGHFQFPYEETPDGWHRYAVDWSPEGYTFYADGRVVGVQSPPECPVSHVEQFILVSTEVGGYNRIFEGDTSRCNQRHLGDDAYWQGRRKEAIEHAVLPDWFEVDYVRVFDRV